MGGSDLGLADRAAQERLRELWEQGLPRCRVKRLLEDGTTKFGVVESASAGSAVISWEHTPDDPEPGHMLVPVETLLNGEDGWRLVIRADVVPRDLQCVIKAPHGAHRYRPAGISWPVVSYHPDTWLDCPGLVDLADYDTFN